jgi:death-on-curing protein
MMLKEITLEQALELHDLSIEKYGGSKGVRDKEGLLAAIARPYATFGSELLYASAFERAAAVGESIIMNHPFVDGNKRTGLLLMDLLLFMEGQRLKFSFEDGYQFVVDLATGSRRFEEAVEWLQEHSAPIA